MNTRSDDVPSQSLRDQLATAVVANDLDTARQLLSHNPLLANADLRELAHRDEFTHGHPLYRAAERNQAEFVELLLDQGSDADAPGNDPDNRPELGMPLHFAAAEHRNYRLANLLLDRGASPDSYPNCDKATIERMFYQAREAGMSAAMVRRSFARYLPDQVELEMHSLTELAGSDLSDAIGLYARMVDLGAQAPFTALVREGFDDLLLEIIAHCPHEPGTPHDHPNSKVWNNIFGAARWYGYPELLRRLMQDPRYQYSYESAISTIGVAIGSHNRDGSYSAYRQMIVMQLEELKSHDDLEEAQQDVDFRPLYEIATDFTWHSNYGYRAEIAQPECYVDLAELFVTWGFQHIEHRDPESGHSPLSAAVKRGNHPGIATYIRWLLEHGADLRLSDPDDVNPIKIAQEKELEEILELLLTFDDGDSPS